MPLFEAALTLVNFGGTVHHLKTATILHALQNYGDYFEKVNFRITTAIMYNINFNKIDPVLFRDRRCSSCTTVRKFCVKYNGNI